VCEALLMSTVSVDVVRPGITKITLDRPDRLNAMSAELIDDLHDALDAVAADRECRVVVLTGAGRAFCAGLDLRDQSSSAGVAELGRVQAGLEWQQRIAALIPKLRGMRQPVIAAVNGAAAGGGLALALGSDVRVAAASARFNVAFVKIGLSGCDIGVSWLLPRLVGASKAFELLLTGRFVAADEAERMGLVSRVVADGDVVDAALEVADQIAANSPFGVWMTKEVMWSNLETASLHAGIDLENRTQILASLTDDMREAVKAFLEKRPPDFQNR
jgi:enoyl-CoA hydratase